MNWIESDKVDWRRLLDDGPSVVIQMRRGEVSDFICGQVVLISNRNDLEIENYHQGAIALYTYEVEKVLVLSENT